MSKSSSINTSIPPLSRGEDGVGVAVSLPLLLPLLLAVGRQGLLQLLLALEEVATRAHDVLLDFAVALHVGEHLVQPGFPFHGGAGRGSWKGSGEETHVNRIPPGPTEAPLPPCLRKVMTRPTVKVITWGSASVHKGVFRSGLRLLFIKVELGWSERPVIN